MPLVYSPPHLDNLLSNVGEVLGLLDIHRFLAGSGPGRKRDVEILHKSAIVLLVACWEGYVEDIAEVALDFMIKNASDHTVFPVSVLERVADKNSGKNAWNLAGDGWKNALKSNFSEVLAKTTGALNTPKTAQVNDLFLKTLGVSKISSSWSWRGRTSADSCAALDALVSLRGEIAHRVKNPHAVRKADVVAATELISRLATKTHNKVDKHVEALVGKAPWGGISYKGMA